MAIGDVEFPLSGPHAKELQHWSSTWLDLIQVGQMLHMALEMKSGDMARDIYTRRALLDDALVTYGRLFNSGRRSGTVDLMPWIQELGEDSVAAHVIGAENCPGGFHPYTLTALTATPPVQDGKEGVRAVAGRRILPTSATVAGSGSTSMSASRPCNCAQTRLTRSRSPARPRSRISRR